MDRLPPALPTWPIVDAIIDRALEEDLAGGDITTEACIDPRLTARATLIARSAVVVAGIDVAVRVFQRLAPEGVEVISRVRDASRTHSRGALVEIRASARALLGGERVALNLVQRLSGVATLTRRYVDALPAGSATRIADTRKTTPGLRALERYAVRCGGGHNHRDTLGSAILLKDNHLAAAGGVRAAIGRARSNAPHTSRIECEVETLAQLDEALDAGVDILLLDNMDDAMTARAVARVRDHSGHRVIVEASGGITIARVGVLAGLGVDVISVGALTHSAPAADIGLDLTL